MSAEMKPPVWLNTTFLRTAIGNGQEDVDVLEYEVGPAVPEGSNYLGCLYRVKLNYKHRYSKRIHNTSVIVKTPLISGILKDIADKINTDGREVEMYNSVLPQINRYLGRRISPKNYLSLRNDVLVLEDLSRQGYSMCDRIKQLDHEHCLSCMKALAKLHASSVALHEDFPELIEKVGKEVLFTKGIEFNEVQHDILVKSLTYTSNALKGVKVYRRFGEIVLKEVHSTWDKIVGLFPRKNHIKVLNHGDMWTNNILFKYDKDGRIEDVKLIDFQVCRYGTPGADIQYFLVTCPNADVRRSGFTDLVDEYRDTLNATLRQLNCNLQLSAEELEEEIRSAEPYALFIMCTLLPLVMADYADQPKSVDDKSVLESFDPNVDAFQKNYYNRRFLDLVVEHLQQLEASAYFG